MVQASEILHSHKLGQSYYYLTSQWSNPEECWQMNYVNEKLIISPQQNKVQQKNEHILGEILYKDLPKWPIPSS